MAADGKNVLIMAGGTGGHVFPALACAREFQARGYSVHWLGTPRGIENELVPQAGLPLHLIQVTGLRGKGKLSLLKAPFTLVKAVLQARRIVRQLKPVCVVGFGGYVTGPGGVAARLCGVPLVIHEQNAARVPPIGCWCRCRHASAKLSPALSRPATSCVPPATRCVRSCSWTRSARPWPSAVPDCWSWAAAWVRNH